MTTFVPRIKTAAKLAHLCTRSVSNKNIYAINMGPKQNKIPRERVGGTPNALPVAELPTTRDLVRYFYHLTHVFENHDTDQNVDLITKELPQLWKQLNPKLEVIPKKDLRRKVVDLVRKVIQINANQFKQNLAQFFTSRLDKLFDISRCKCKLQIKSCSDVGCEQLDCSVKHIVCLCSSQVCLL